MAQMVVGDATLSVGHVHVERGTNIPETREILSKEQ